MDKNLEKKKSVHWGPILLVVLSSILISNLIQINSQGTKATVQRKVLKYVDWKEIADSIIVDYQGKILSIEQLNGTTCWAILSSKISMFDAIGVSERIGDHIKNTTGRTPTVRVFINGRQVAMARPSGNRYAGQTKVETWNPMSFGGSERP